MKLRKVIIVYLMIITCIPIYSQLIKDYGIKIGVSSSNIKVENLQLFTVGDVTYDVEFPDGNFISPTISLWAKVIDNKIINLELETLYILKGLSETENISVLFDGSNGASKDVEFENSIYFGYLQININAQLKYDIDKVIAYGILGPTISYYLGYSNYVLNPDKMKDINFGYNIGIGLDFGNLIGKGIFIEAKYNSDFNKFYNHKMDLWHKVWTLNIGTNI